MKATKEQIRQLHVLAARLGMDKDAYRNMLYVATGGRTDTAAGLSEGEAAYLAGYLQGSTPDDLVKRTIRRHRSGVLKCLTRLGVDTSDWDKVNAYLCQKKICGKKLYELSLDELAALRAKLEAIIRKKHGSGQGTD